MQGAKGPDTQTQPGPMPGALLSVSKARGACICHLRSSLPLKPRPSPSLNLISDALQALPAGGGWRGGLLAVC